MDPARLKFNKNVFKSYRDVFLLQRLCAIKKTLEEKLKTKPSSDDEDSDLDTDSSTNR
jgi:hypothetical protein